MQAWAFADFKTAQSTTCFNGMNYEGVFTRESIPKRLFTTCVQDGIKNEKKE
jgi:hypothetical protein